MSTKTKTGKVYVTLLRQPRIDMNEMRTDPFWEFGSFGLTGCHQRNLLHPKRSGEMIGARLAFVQGGSAGFKLVYLTPPVTPVAFSDRTEMCWESGEMPFRYEQAPFIISTDGMTDFPKMLDIFKDVNRGGWMGRFASKFRTRCEALPADVAKQLIGVYDKARQRAGKIAFAATYTDALPVKPPKTDCSRRETYDRLRSEAQSR